MTRSMIVTAIIGLWKKIVICYDESVAARLINSVCGFFVKKSSGSLFVTAFKHGIINRLWWENSLLYRIMTFPIPEKRAKKESKSRIAHTVLNVFNIPLKTLGLGLLCYAMPILVLSLFEEERLNILVSVALLLLGALWVVFSRSLHNLMCGSSVLSFFRGFFFEGDSEEKEEIELSLAHFLPWSFAFGVCAAIISPILTTLIIIGVLFVTLILLRYEAGVYMTLFLAAFLPTSAIAALSAVTVLGFGIAVLTHRKKLKPSILAPFILVYVILAIFSTATSFDISGSAFIFAVYLVFILMYSVMVNTFDTPRLWRNGVILFVMSAFFISLYGIAQNFFLDTSANSWIDSDMFGDITARVYATFDNPNVLGQYFIITLPIIFAIFTLTKKSALKTAWLVILGTGFLCLIYTWSRGAWVGVLLGVAIFLLLRDRRFIMLGVLLVLILPFVLPDSIMNRLLSIGDVADSSTAYRVSVWIASARMAMKFWMSGVGYGSTAFSAVYSAFALDGAGFALHSHNFYIQLIADVGIGGLIVFVCIALTAYNKVSERKTDPFVRAVTFALTGVLTGYLFQGIAESMWYNLRMSLMFWIFTAFIISSSSLNEEMEK